MNKPKVLEEIAKARVAIDAFDQHMAAAATELGCEPPPAIARGLEPVLASMEKIVKEAKP